MVKETAEWCHNSTRSIPDHVLRTRFLLFCTLQDQPEVDGSPLAGDPLAGGNAHTITNYTHRGKCTQNYNYPFLYMPNPRGGGTR